MLAAHDLPLETKLRLRSFPVGPDADYSPKEVATLAGMSVSTLYRLWESGGGPARRRIGGRVVVSGDAYLHWHASKL